MRQRLDLRSGVIGLELAFTALFAAVAIAYPVFRGLIAPNPEIDFRFYWFAGHMWANGLDPYSPAFSELGNRLLPAGSDLRYWFYPPQWWPVARLLALFDFSTALQVWRAALTVILIVSTASVVALLSQGLPPTRRAWLVAGACALATTMESSADVLAGGQVSPVFVYAGMALIICSFLTERSALLVLGLVLVSLKPQTGALIFLAFAISPAHWRSVAFALLAILLLSLPQLLGFGLLTTIKEMVRNFRGFSSIAGNIPLAMTGPSHLLARFGFNFPLSLSLGLAVAAAIAAGIILQRAPRSLSGLALLLSSVCAFVPLHNYDMTMVVLVAVLALTLNQSRASKLMVAFALLLSVRPSHIEGVFGVRVYADASAGVMTYSAISILLFGLVLMCTASRQTNSERVYRRVTAGEIL